MDFRILIVDDEYPIREWLTYLIRQGRPDYDVDSAENGVQALEKLSETPFDLVITDIRMPHMDGLELLKNITVHYPSTGTIVLSSYDDYNYVRSTFKYDAADYLLKTEIDSENLLGSIDSFLQAKSTAENTEYFIHQIRELLKGETDSQALLLSCLSSYADYEPSDSFFFVILKFYSVEDAPKPYYPAVKETSFSFSVPLGENLFIGCIDLAIHPSLLTQLQLQSVYLKQLEKYNDLALLLYTDILSPKSSLLKEMRRLYTCRDLDFYHIRTYNPALLPAPKDFAIKERYLHTRKTLLTSDAKAVLTEAGEFLDCVKEHLYTDIEDLKFMCSKIYESAYFTSHTSDPLEYARYMPRISSLISQAASWEELKAVFTESLSALYRQPPGLTVNLSPRIARAVSIIENNYMTPLTLGSVAEELHVNPEYLSRSFKKEVGVNFNAYLNSVRLQQAMLLLRNPKILISEIAVETGFQNPAYFSKCFKTSFGISPQEWRNQNS